jgi:hypothetical protein
MMQTKTMGPQRSGIGEVLPSQSLVALLALVGSKQMEVANLRNKTKLTHSAFEDLLVWLQQEYLVDVVTNLEGSHVAERVELTEKGEAVLVGMLEKTCELPELH